MDNKRDSSDVVAPRDEDSQTPARGARIRVGTASWTDHEPFYPDEYNKASMKAQRISYYARYFSLVEVDSTFYSLQPMRNFQMWAERTPEDFIFDVKAYGELTWHHRDEQGQPQTPHADTFARFSEMIHPLRERQKLGAILFQFAPWYTFSDDRLEYFETIREALPNDTIAVEFRHRSWLDAKNVASVKAALSEQRLAYCAVDEPQIGSGSVPPVVLLTDPHFSMARFHGRNTHTWYGKGLSSSRDRFDYLYTRDELAPWAERAKHIAAQLQGSELHIIMNNNASNYGIVNAFDMQELLGQPVGLGQPLPPGVIATQQAREEQASASRDDAE
ncbi:MAG TPA: DUF72 domain-containing protein [Ktedonobacterales bacterium]|nr:DUF72 domain-containing protein [Ktedonobacterales bacterium]